MNDAALAASPTQDDRVPLAAWLSLAAMVAVAIYAIIDRQIFILLAEAIKKDMSLSDTQLGLLQGVGLAGSWSRPPSLCGRSRLLPAGSHPISRG